MSVEPFTVDNAGNTCYIDSLLMGLFYHNTHIERLLNKDIKNTLGLYIQEYIKENFINLVRKNKSVVASDMEMFRILVFQAGWRKNSNLPDEEMNQQDVNEFYIFLMDILENDKIEIIRRTITEGMVSDNDVGIKELLPFIPLSLPENDTKITVKEMIHNWLYNNVIDVTRKVDSDKEKMIKGLATFNLINMPQIIALSINRFNNIGIRIDTSVIIQKKICINTSEWVFHAAICHRGNSLTSGHYYTLISVNNTKWYIFNDMDVPCMKEVGMDDPDVTNLIKQECVFLIYRLL